MRTSRRTATRPGPSRRTPRRRRVASERDTGPLCGAARRPIAIGPAVGREIPVAGGRGIAGLAIKKWRAALASRGGRARIQPSPELQEHCVNKIFLIALCIGLVACTNKKKEEEGREPVQS